MVISSPYVYLLVIGYHVIFSPIARTTVFKTNEKRCKRFRLKEVLKRHFLLSSEIFYKCYK